MNMPELPQRFLNLNWLWRNKVTEQMLCAHTLDVQCEHCKSPK